MQQFSRSIGFTAISVFLLSLSMLAQTPTITSISPNPGGIGQSVTITGTNYGTSGSVTFSGVMASTTSWTATSIIATVPVGAASGSVIVTANGHASNGFSFTLNNGPVNYLYDDLGRLAAVIDVSGNAAEYSYDAVGNTLSISRLTATQVSIVNFSPESGPVGTTVSINGTGFSTTPAQNTVKFNGTSATVSSATGNQLQVTVPSGATNGPISVTSPNGSTASTGSFTVTSSSGMPAITGFSPASGIAGTPVTVSGANFDLVPANDKLRLNASQATVSAATSSSISTTVPSSTASGHFALIAPAGNATSSQDFYVPFLAHVPGDIGFTARIAPGGTQPLTLAAGKIAMVLFDGVEGQHADVGWSGTTFSTCNLYLIAPDNSTTATATCTSGSTDLGSTYLPKSGTYTIGIDPGTTGGSLTLSLSGDSIGTIAVGGQAVAVSTTAPGQDVRLSFPSAGQHVVIQATNVTNPGATVNLMTQSGLGVATMAINNSVPGQTFFIQSQLVGDQVYQLWVQHNGTNVGNETLQIIPDFTGTLTLPSTAGTSATVQVPTTGNLTIGQNAALFFSGAAGQKVSFNLLNSTIGPPDSPECGAALFDPNGVQLLPTPYYCTTGGQTYIDTTTLASTGNYKLYLMLQQTATGNISISVNNDQDVTTPKITIGGAATSYATTVVGQDVILSFTAAAGKRVVVYATNVTNPQAYLNLVTSGSIIADALIYPSPNQFFLDTQTLTATGNELWVQHTGTNIGGETLQIVSVPNDISHAVTIGGSAYSFSTVAGQNANITFSNSTSQSVTVHWTSSTYPNNLGCSVKVTGPSPSTTQVGAGTCNTPTGTVSLGTLSSGSYNVLIDPEFWSTGGLSLNVTTP